MRPHVHRARAITGAFCFASTCAATLPAAAHAQSQGGTTPVLRAADRVTAGSAVVATGTAPGHRGRTIVLHHRPRAGGAFRRLAATRVGKGDRFRFRVAVPRSGVLRASIAPAAGAASAAALASTTNEQVIAVARAVRVRAARLHVRVGGRARVAGAVAPAAAGVPVRLQGRRDGGWRTLDRARTRAGGAYRLSERVRSTGSMALRVVTAGGDGLVGGRRSAGAAHGYRSAYASWYGPGLYGSPLGCGGAPLQPGQLGVAHKTLPCGTRVTFRHEGRSVTVPVIDRGPYVAGREYDLTEATADRLGFRGHGPILATR